MYILRTFVPTKVPKTSAQCRLRARLRLAFSAAPTAAEAILFPSAVFSMRYTYYYHLPRMSSKTGFQRQDKPIRYFLEKCGCNDTVDVFCPVEFIPFVLRGLVSHRLMRGVKPPRVGKARQQIHGKLLL